MNKFVCLLLICWYTAMQAGEQGSLSCSLLRHESDDWVWSNMEVPEFTINLRNDSDSTLEARAKMIVVTDHGNAFITLEKIDSITPKTSKDITFKLDGENKPAIAGFYRATFFVNDETV